MESRSFDSSNERYDDRINSRAGYLSGGWQTTEPPIGNRYL